MTSGIELRRIPIDTSKLRRALNFGGSCSKELWLKAHLMTSHADFLCKDHTRWAHLLWVTVVHYWMVTGVFTCTHLKTLRGLCTTGYRWISNSNSTCTPQLIKTWQEKSQCAQCKKNTIVVKLSPSWSVIIVLFIDFLRLDQIGHSCITKVHFTTRHSCIW